LRYSYHLQFFGGTFIAPYSQCISAIALKHVFVKTVEQNVNFSKGVIKMAIFFGFLMILLGALITETPIDHKLSLAVILVVAGTVIAIDGYIKLLRKEFYSALAYFLH
jgi:hypothetical protein